MGGAGRGQLTTLQDLACLVVVLEAKTNRSLTPAAQDTAALGQGQEGARLPEGDFELCTRP